jgi:hypothetical protein
MEPTRTFDLLTRLLDNFPDKKDVLAGKEEGKWKLYSVQE